MAICPLCGNEIKNGENICGICGCNLKNFSEKVEESKSESPSETVEEEKEDSGKNEGPPPAPNPSDTTLDSDEVEDEHRQKWLEQQKALRDELSGLKSSLKNEIEQKKEIYNTVPTPLAYPHYYYKKPEYDMITRNLSDLNIRIVDKVQRDETFADKEAKEVEISKAGEIEEKEKVKNAPKNMDIDDSEIENEDIPLAIPVIDEQKGTKDHATPQQIESKTKDNGEKIRPPVKINKKSLSKNGVSPKGLLKVDTIIDNEDNDVESKNSELSGAINRIVSHEKIYKSKGMKMKLSSPVIKPAIDKRTQTEEALKNLEESIKRLSNGFNGKPVQQMIARSKKKLKKNDINAAFEIAHNAKKTFSRLQQHYSEATDMLKKLSQNYPDIKKTEHNFFKRYEKIKATMRAGQYFKVIRHVNDIENDLNAFLSRSKDKSDIETGIETEQLTDTSEIHKRESTDLEHPHLKDENKKESQVGSVIDWDNSEDNRKTQSRSYPLHKSKKTRKKKRRRSG
jgi:hypothetical protein